MNNLPLIGFVGLGAMGLPMASCLIAQGYRVLGYDTNPERMRLFAEQHGELPALRVFAGAIARRILGEGVSIRGALVQIGADRIDGVAGTGAGERSRVTELLDRLGAAADALDPLTYSFISAACDKAWFGWPCDAEITRLRDEFADEVDEARQIGRAHV